ncbi:SH3 domain-containing protein [Phaeobacter inhibens]|uniref:SH3 domain-containing protein n=1 Tax=Phaeobacter inhibens TaxID=221822 RepID=UPI0021A81F19|nr:SH3 domain-containing protein [Phaeobacter inhibens]UWR48398.1 SH3 domain-containing protein [Phaeobacter inhibens]
MPIHAQEIGDLANIDTELLNVRSGPGADTAVVGRVSQGTLMLVVERQGDWVKLSDPLRRGLAEGWVNSRFLTVSATGEQTDPQRPTAPTAQAPRYVPRPDPFQIADADFECNESYLNEGGFDECELKVQIEVNIPSIFEPYLKDYVDVTCEAEISYRTGDSYFEQSERESESTSLYLYSGVASETLKIEFDFGYTFEPVVSAKVESLECRPE